MLYLKISHIDRPTSNQAKSCRTVPKRGYFDVFSIASYIKKIKKVSDGPSKIDLGLILRSQLN